MGSIPVAIYSKLGSKNKKHLRGSTWVTIRPLAIILTVALWALVSMINSLGEYCRPHTASSVFLILVCIHNNYLLYNSRFFMSMFYQLLCVQHSCSSTQSWGSILPSIVKTRDQNSRGCPLLFLNRNLGSFCA